MKSKTDQLDFDFSRPIDFQRNISSELLMIVFLGFSKKIKFSI